VSHIAAAQSSWPVQVNQCVVAPVVTEPWFLSNQPFVLKGVSFANLALLCSN
jgi:hypothetical protein